MSISEIASPFKVAFHKEKLTSYLRGESIFPATLELDITSKCTRMCADCPSSRSKNYHYLHLKFISNLMACLEGETKGLILTGGEPTSSPQFSNVLSLARERGFLEIAVVTNGSFLHEERVADSLVSHASAVRISLYDWGIDSCGGIKPILERIEALRSKIDRGKSPLQIGVSLLTLKEKTGCFFELAESVRSAGAHWIYFHPACIGWDLGRPTQVNQDGVLEKIEAYQKTLSTSDGFHAFVCRRRYLDTELEFNRYHAAHFLLVIGADGLNYLGPEVKYQPQYVLSDVASSWDSDFLWKRVRLERINSIKSNLYPALKSRHRGVLYNDLIERMLRIRSPLEERFLLQKPEDFKFPHIL